MKIKIIRNSKPKSWYRERIGETFEVLDTNESRGFYITHRGRLVDSFVSFEDCEIIEE